MWGSGAASTAGEGLDRRFADPAWVGNPLLNRIALAYLAYCDTNLGILEDADVDWRTRERLRLLRQRCCARAHERPAAEPGELEGGHRHRGPEPAGGPGNLLTDLHSPAKLPTSVDKSAFDPGETSPPPRDRSCEAPDLRADPVPAPRQNVDVVPLLVIPSPVNKYYLLDLEPEQSVARAELDAGARSSSRPGSIPTPATPTSGSTST